MARKITSEVTSWNQQPAFWCAHRDNSSTVTSRGSSVGLACICAMPCKCICTLRESSRDRHAMPSRRNARDEDLISPPRFLNSAYFHLRKPSPSSQRPRITKPTSVTKTPFKSGTLKRSGFSALQSHRQMAHRSVLAAFSAHRRRWPDPSGSKSTTRNGLCPAASIS